ncbi:MAG TPA: hypothetical protein VFH95_15680 [Candidatus Kapabacteria bacterium]|nr:hypothetical protein [Candidatus Kapabacteria bacterium]
MNDFEQEEQPLSSSAMSENTVTNGSIGERESFEEMEALEETADAVSNDTISEQDEASADAAAPEQEANPARPATVLVKREPRKKFRMGPAKTKSFRQFVSIGWSGEREPATDLIWAEAVLDGKWIVIDTLERVPTRKEIVERILSLQAALVTLDFNFSYPTTFFDLLRETEGIGDWHSMIHTIRRDVKKNVDDGLRLWAERMGRYRESQLDPEVPRGKLQRSRRYDDWGWSGGQKGLAPHEQLSLARRFRHTDLPLRGQAGTSMMSTMQIGYNRLTERYEFNGNIRGRPALLGMAMLDQLLEAGRKDLAIWPMMESRALTIAESLPWLFTEGKLPEPSELENIFKNYEDAGWEISNTVRAAARKNPAKREALFTLMGVVKTEQRLHGRRGHLPIRDYNPAIYHDPRVQLEGWIYGIGYRPPEAETDSRHERPKRDRKIASAENGEQTTSAPLVEETSTEA